VFFKKTKKLKIFNDNIMYNKRLLKNKQKKNNLPKTPHKTIKIFYKQIMYTHQFKKYPQKQKNKLLYMFEKKIFFIGYF